MIEENINSTKILEQNKNSWDAMAGLEAQPFPATAALSLQRKSCSYFLPLPEKKFLISAAEAAIP